MQYWKLKESHPRHLIMMQIGDFYELFGQDAETASHCLGITLTRRSAKGK